MRAIRYAAAAMLAGLFTQGASAACYIVYAADKQVVYRSQISPVNLEPHLHRTVPQIVPGGTMVFTLDNFACDLEINRLPTASGSAGSGFTQRPARADRG
ncbi:MAG: hypothetical protein EOO31_07260 [Comamonadaceae bacterium]|nr:MAG: hypothetical protein EOO31_07260 [Comamonadaceae bacterium]